jgi:hypothetical protein
LDNANNIPNIVSSGAGANGTTGDQGSNDDVDQDSQAPNDDGDQDPGGGGVITIRARGESGTKNINLMVCGSTVGS